MRIDDKASVPPVEAPMAMRSICAALGGGVMLLVMGQGTGFGGAGGCAGLEACQISFVTTAPLPMSDGRLLERSAFP